MRHAKFFRQQLKQGQVPIGTCVLIQSPFSVEALCTVFDVLFIDTEHSATDLLTLQNMVMATKGTDTCALVRVANNDPTLVKAILDLGADGIIFPMVTTVEDARRAIAACLYPPHGVRGFGPMRANNFGFGYSYASDYTPATYCAEANESVIPVLQIEHIDAMDNLDEILELPNVGSLFLGANDFALSMGHAGRPDHPEVVKELHEVVRRARAAGVSIGVIANGQSKKDIQQWLELGASWLILGADLGLLLGSANRAVELARSVVKVSEA